ncbi:MAG: thioredoxin domain-containing protein [Desulfobulbaceae bacterium]|nr:thioredoxin domain-containing protein [Desulfobulbaceae bacterium]
MFEKNPETVRIVIKNYPLSRHKFAEQAARASLAADRQGMFWEFQGKLFDNYKKLSAEKIDGIADELKLDMKHFKTDMESQAIRQQVKRDRQDGRKAGVSGTPILFVNGIKVRDRSIAGIQKLIDEQLTKKIDKK